MLDNMLSNHQSTFRSKRLEKPGKSNEKPSRNSKISSWRRAKLKLRQLKNKQIQL